MRRTQPRLVVGRNGLRAHVEDGYIPGGEVTLRLADGARVLVPADALVAQPDGSYTIALGPDDLTSRAVSGDGTPAGLAETVAKIPLVEETARIEKRVHESGRVVVHVTPHEEKKTIDVPLVEEQVDVRRVPVNRFIDGPIEMRQEGDTTIVPVVEEVLVVEKKLMLREEVHVTRRRVTTHERQDVVLRREEARILHSDEGTRADD
jgi:uncharacterized protein (TIGR02271 family)